MTNLATELERLSASATPGPWRHIPGHIEEGPPAIRAPEGWLICSTADDATAALIVALRNNLPAIIAALKAAELPDDVAGLVAELSALYSYPQAVADTHADILTPRQIDKLYEVGNVAERAKAAITALSRQLAAMTESRDRHYDAYGDLLTQLAEREAKIARLQADFERIDDLFSEAVQSDCENGVRWLTSLNTQQHLWRSLRPWRYAAHWRTDMDELMPCKHNYITITKSTTLPVPYRKCSKCGDVQPPATQAGDALVEEVRRTLFSHWDHNVTLSALVAILQRETAAAHAAGVAEERAKVVAWLRVTAASPIPESLSDFHRNAALDRRAALSLAANHFERGQHKEPGDE